MLWYRVKFAWEISESGSCRVWGSNKDSWRSATAGDYRTALFSSSCPTMCFWHSEDRRTGRLSLACLTSFLYLRWPVLPQTMWAVWCFLSKGLSYWRIFFLNSILSPNVIVPLCRQTWSLWVHLGPWDSSLISGRFRIRQGIRTSAINPEKGNARFIWLLACDLWTC